MRSHFTNLATIASVLTAISLTAAGPVEVTRDYVNATPQVKTIYEGGEQVTYQGYLNATTNLEQFVGIPFAQPPIGRLRFQRPQPWSPDNVTFFNATTPPPVCAQPGNNVSTENCLQLNVVRHTGVESGEKLPVLVWIYGGNYVSGYR
ncbi:hypothetical protein I302_107908 [Kwoniella bestiolae CBS 10118]|uniref:Carboxylesterase type B domain-containing protein n=1 Tax=Kwoniella bestiolae CBS 10118 TaxID=1296100 RepID=A0AAJ8KEH3_9TREE